MASSGEREEQQRALRIVSKCSSVDEFVSIFRRFCDEKSLFIVTKKPKPLREKPQFTITLADGKPMLTGSGTVVESYPDKHNSFGRPGMKLRFDDLDAHSRDILQRLNQARKAKKNTPPPLPRHMRPKSEGEAVPPASPELRGLGDAEPLEEGEATQVDAEPLVEVTQAAAKEERRKGSDFILPANPFGELTDASLEAFVECTLYEETGSTDFVMGELSSVAGALDGGEQVGVVVADSAPSRGLEGEGDEASERIDAEQAPARAASPTGSRPIAVPTSIPPIQPTTSATPGSGSVASPQGRAAPSGPSGGTPAAGLGALSSAAPATSTAPGATPAAGADISGLAGHPVGSAAYGTVGATAAAAQGARADLTPLPHPRPDLTPTPEALGAGMMYQVGDVTDLGIPRARAWSAKHIALAGVVTLILGLVLGYFLWGRGNGADSGKPSDGTGARAAVDKAPTPPDAAPATANSAAGDAASAVGVGAGDEDVAEADAGPESAAAPADPGAATEEEEAGAGAVSGGADELLSSSDACALELTTLPDEARVRAGGRWLGKTPYLGELPCDVGSVQITHPRYQKVDRRIDLVPGETTRLEVKLERPTFQLRVVSSPKGATVTVGRRRVGKAPVTAKVIGFERTTVKVSGRGYKTHSEQVYPKSPVTTINVTLEKKPRSGTANKRRSR